MPPAPTSLTQWNSLQQQSAEQVDLSKLLETIRAALRADGIMAWVSLGLNLERSFAQSENAGLGKGSVKRIFNDSNVPLSDVDARAIVRYIAQDDDAKVTPDAIKNLVCGALTGRRLDLVQSVFEHLDRKHVGYIAYADILSAHDAQRHPSVMFGEKSVEQVHDEFQTSFQAATRHGGTSFVNLYQWMSYFQYICGNVPSDEYFDLLMKRVWKATSRTSLSEVAGASLMPDDAMRGTAGNSSGCNMSASMTLLQALQESNPAMASTYSKASSAVTSLSVATALPSSIPSRLHHSSSVTHAANTAGTNFDGVSSRAAHTTTEFLKGAQFAACMVDPALRQPSPSSNSSYLRRSTVSPPHSAAPTVDAGTTSVLSRVRATIKDRGLRGLVELSRNIRLSDVDSDGFVSLAEFKRAVGGSLADVQLSDVDLRCLFNHLDVDRRGVVALHAVLNLIREPMNYRRFQLVQAAFQTIDRDGSGKLEPNEIVQAYDASKHPEVISGRKDEDAVFHEFLESFDVESSSDNAGDGKISFAQWEQYYQNVSFFITDDDFFDLMLRNTWQLAHLQLDDDLYASSGSAGASGIAPVSPSRTLANAVYRVPRGSGHGSSQAFAILQPGLRDHQQQQRHGNPALAHHGAGPTAPNCMFAATKQTKELRRIISQLRAALKEQGVVGFISLQRKFHLMDDDQNGSISLSEFQRALKESKLHVAPHDTASLFQYFDANHDGAVDFTEFLTGIREPMNERRMLFVRMAFDILDKDSNGVLEVSDIVDVYDARKRPDVLSGRKTEHDVFTEFLETFDVAHDRHDGKVTLDDWTRYYANISASIDDDDYFELMMRNAWHISGGEGWCANSTTRRVLVTLADGTDVVREVENDLGVKPQGVHARLQLQDQRAASANSSSSGSAIARVVGSSSSLDLTDVPVTPATRGPPTASSTGKKIVTLREASSAAPMEMAAVIASNANPVAASAAGAATTPGDVLFHTIRYRLRQKRVSDIVQLRKRALQYIDAKTGTISARHCSECLNATLGLTLSEESCVALFAFVQQLPDAMRELDLRSAATGASSSTIGARYVQTSHASASRIAIRKLLQCVLGTLSPSCADAAQRVFSALQAAGKGRVFPAALAKSFQAQEHPDVRFGGATASAVFQEFAASFEVSGGGISGDGAIAFEHFEAYCVNLCATLGSDELLQLLLRDCFRAGV